MPSDALVPQLLMAYHPRYNARTIRVHVERLREKGTVWWGRFYGGDERFDEATVRARWPHLAALADERNASREPTLLFATNHNDLHVLKVTRILLGDDPEGGKVRREALPYYKKQSVPMWFEVADVRSLSFEHARTFEWYEHELGLVLSGATRPSGKPFTRRYDPTGAVLYEFPIILEAPRCAAMFDEPPPDGAKRWADARDAITARPVQRAREKLPKLLVPGLCEGVHVEVRDRLAAALVEQGRLRQDEDIDPCMGFGRIGSAIEVELCDGLIGELVLLRDRLKKAQSPAHEVLTERFAEAAKLDSMGRPEEWTLGSGARLLKDLVNKSRKTIEGLRAPKLLALCTNMKWVDEMTALRNLAGHKATSADWPAVRAGVYGFFEKRGKGLVAIVEAKEEVAGLRKRGG